MPPDSAHLPGSDRQKCACETKGEKGRHAVSSKRRVTLSAAARLAAVVASSPPPRLSPELSSSFLPSLLPFLDGVSWRVEYVLLGLDDWDWEDVGIRD